MTDTFNASVESFVETSLLFHTAVLKQSAEDFYEDAQAPRPEVAYKVPKAKKTGRMRVDTGTLRNSHVSGLNGSTSMSGDQGFTLTIANFKLGDILNGGWTADYAVHREFGARGQAPDFFARGAAQKWQSFVDKNAAKLKGMIR